MKELNGVIKK